MGQLTIDWIGYILYILFFILLPIALLIGLGYVAVMEFIEDFKSE
jgi:hypothetical protein